MSLKYGLLVVLVSWACTVRSAAQLDGPTDLTWVNDATAKVCSVQPNFEYIEQIINTEGTWYSVNSFTTHEHCGTHIDAPYHFDPDGITVDKIPLSRLLVTAAFIDVSAETGDDSNYTMPLSKLKDWEAANGPLPDNSVLLVKFGWSSRYWNRTAYLGHGADYRYPGVAAEVAQYLLDSGKVVGLGVDSASPDRGYDVATGNFPVHVMMLKAGLYLLENVSLTPQLPPLFKLIVAPMKNGGGTGGPTRLIALPDHFNL